MSADARVVDVLGVDRLARIGLAEVDATAALQRRVDRKYLCSTATATDLVERLSGSHRVLSVAGRLSTHYRTVYLDTPDLRSCREHLQGRRRRWKARTRVYVEDGLARLEVKLRDGGSDTVKSALDLDGDGAAGWTEHRDFIDAVLAGQGLVRPGDLAPTVEIRYERVTLVDTVAGTRLTVDTGLTGRVAGPDASSGEVRLDEGLVVVETKGHLRAGAADRELLALGVRPTSFSKYAACASVLSPRLADNHVRRLLGRGLTLSPLEGVA